MEYLIRVPKHTVDLLCKLIVRSQKKKKNVQQVHNSVSFVVVMCLFTWISVILSSFQFSTSYFTFSLKKTILWHEICLYLHEYKQICATFHLNILFNTNVTIYGNRKFCASHQSHLKLGGFVIWIHHHHHCRRRPSSSSHGEFTM